MSEWHGNVNYGSFRIVDNVMRDGLYKALHKAEHYSEEYPIFKVLVHPVENLVGYPLHDVVLLISTGKPDPNHPKLGEFLKECAG
jgi:hypothetical protein